MGPWLEPLRHRDYRNLWFGHFVSLVGTNMTSVAITWQLYELTNKSDPLALGALGLAKAAPLIIFANVGGTVADAVDRRRLLMTTQASFMLLSALLALATMRGLVTVPLLYAVAVATGAVTAFDNPARQALVVNLVSKEAVPRALTLWISTFTVATTIGPALGGLVLAARGPALVYSIDAASFLAVLLALAVMRYRPGAGVAREKSRLGWFDGWKFVWGVPILWSTMVIDFLATLAADCRQLMPFFADTFVREGAHGLEAKTVLGLLYAAPAAAAFVTSLVMTWLDPPRAQGKLVLISVAIYGLSIAAFGVCRSFELGLVLLLIYGAADTVSMAIRNVIRQEVTPDELRGRMISVNMIFFIGGPQLGELEAGAVARWLDVRSSVVLGGLGCFVVSILYGLRAPWLRRYVRDPLAPVVPHATASAKPASP